MLDAIKVGHLENRLKIKPIKNSWLVQIFISTESHFLQ